MLNALLNYAKQLFILIWITTAVDSKKNQRKDLFSSINNVLESYCCYRTCITKQKKSNFLWRNYFLFAAKHQTAPDKGKFKLQHLARYLLIAKSNHRTLQNACGSKSIFIFLFIISFFCGLNVDFLIKVERFANARLVYICYIF